MINNEKLAKYLRKRMETQDEVNTIFHLIKVPTESELEFWIQQFKTKDCCGHSEWSELYKRNIRIKDEEEI